MKPQGQHYKQSNRKLYKCNQEINIVILITQMFTQEENTVHNIENTH